MLNEWMSRIRTRRWSGKMLPQKLDAIYLFLVTQIRRLANRNDRRKGTLFCYNMTLWHDTTRSSDRNNRIEVRWPLSLDVNTTVIVIYSSNQLKQKVRGAYSKTRSYSSTPGRSRWWWLVCHVRNVSTYLHTLCIISNDRMPTRANYKTRALSVLANVLLEQALV